jgi:hypothetical protein
MHQNWRRRCLMKVRQRKTSFRPRIHRKQYVQCERLVCLAAPSVCGSQWYYHWFDLPSFWRIGRHWLRLENRSDFKHKETTWNVCIKDSSHSIDIDTCRMRSRSMMREHNSNKRQGWFSKAAMILLLAAMDCAIPLTVWRLDSSRQIPTNDDGLENSLREEFITQNTNLYDSKEITCMSGW